jgi:hopanoid biosynthesis associated RND transporter like protein HpnN
LLDDPNTTPYTIDILASDLSAAKTQAQRVGALDVVDKTMTLASFVPDDQAAKMAIIDDINLIMMPVFLPATAGLPPSVVEQTSAIERFQEKLLTIAHSGEGLSNSASRLAGALERLKAQADWPEPALEDLQTRILGDLPANVAKLEKLLSPKPVSLAELPADLKDRYIANDGRARIVVYPKENVSDNEKLRQFVDSVLEVAPTATGAPVTLVESGMVVMGACIQATLSAIVAVCVLLTVVLRSVWTALLILLPLVFALLLTVAMSVILDLPFNFANVIALPLLLGIGVAFGIYLVTRKLGGISVGALLRSSTPRAVLYSGLTTMASFGTLAVSQHRGMSGMGLLVTFALSFALLASLVIVPAIMAAIDELGARRRARAGAGGGSAVAPRAPQPSPREKEAESR